MRTLPPYLFWSFLTASLLATLARFFHRALFDTRALSLLVALTAAFAVLSLYRTSYE